MVKNLPANAGDIKDLSPIPGLGRSLEEGKTTHSSVLAWRIPWTEEPGRLQSMGLQKLGVTEVTWKAHTNIIYLPVRKILQQCFYLELFYFNIF